jgi:hypothetical protein
VLAAEAARLRANAAVALSRLKLAGRSAAARLREAANVIYSAVGMRLRAVWSGVLRPVHLAVLYLPVVLVAGAVMVIGVRPRLSRAGAAPDVAA